MTSGTDRIQITCHARDTNQNWMFDPNEKLLPSDLIFLRFIIYILQNRPSYFCIGSEYVP